MDSNEMPMAVEVSGEPVRWQLPAALPDLPILTTTLSPITGVDASKPDRVVRFSQTGSQAGGTTDNLAPQFFIDGQQFDPAVANQDPRLESVEVWRIENTSQMRHPFHIHVNPFQVIEPHEWDETAKTYVTKSFAPDEARWQDTIALPLPQPSASDPTEPMPNSLSPLIVQGSLGVAFAILAEAGLSFLGVGVQPPSPTSGGMLSKALPLIERASYLSIFPGIAIFITVLAINMLGDALRDVLEPRLRGI